MSARRALRVCGASQREAFRPSEPVVVPARSPEEFAVVEASQSGRRFPPFCQQWVLLVVVVVSACLPLVVVAVVVGVAIVF